MGRLKIVDDHSHDPAKEGGGSCGRGPRVHVMGSDAAGPSARAFVGRAAVVTLGCAKNHVDSEVMLGVLKQRGFEIVSEVAEADVAVVNTCGFLQSAVQESIDCILDIAELKKTGRLRKLVVAGCAVERYSDPSGKAGNIREALPEVDSFISVNDILSVADAANLEAAESPISQLLSGAERPYFLYDDTMPRQLATKRHMAYVKVSEGCNRPCTFCIIPRIRGSMRSRPIDSILKEVEQLAANGVREVNLVAQDLTSFGLDQAEDSYGRGRRLSALLRALDAQGAVDWIRLLYSYPIGIDEALIDAVRDLPRVVEYLDLPLQHASEAVLSRMKRPLGRYSPRSVIEFIRNRAPSLALRTTFIVGFPGETERDIDDLEQFIREGHFSSVGIFTYSSEPGTSAHDMDGQVSERAKKSRLARLMKAQQDVVAKRNSALIGQEIEVLVEGAHEDTDLLLVGRARFQAPEVDGTVIINDVGNINEVSGPGGEVVEAPPEAVDARRILRLSDLGPGSMVTVRVTEVAGYDLVGEVRPRTESDRCCGKSTSASGELAAEAVTTHA